MDKLHNLKAYPTSGVSKELIAGVAVTKLALKNKYLCEVIVNVKANHITGSCINLTTKNK